MKKIKLLELENKSLKDHFISKNDFLNYFKIPKPFWFLRIFEIEDIFIEKDYISEIEELNADDLTNLLTSFDSPIKLLSENSKKLHDILDEKLKEFYKWRFNLSDKDLHDHRIHSNSLEYFLHLINQKKDFFIFKPKIRVKDFSITPAAIIRYKEKIYVIENVFSMTLKRERIAFFIFYDYVFKNILKINIFQYLTSYFRNEESKNLDLNIDITNGLPFSNKEYKPESPIDKKLKNVNTFLFKKIPVYENTLYELFLNRKDFYEINNEEWEFEYLEVEDIIEKLLKFKKVPYRSVNINEIISDFLISKKNLIPADSTLYKLLLKNYFSNYDFSNKIFSFEKMLKKILKSSEENIQNNIINHLSNLNFLNFPKDQDFLLFENSRNDYINKLKNKKKKIYYDFETFLFPLPIFRNTKPYRQLVVQFSSLEMENNIEKKVENLIFDPQLLSINDYKKVIDSLYDESKDIAYIVYNKSFENTRLSEISKMLDDKEYTKKIEWIKKNTVDLADWFVWNKKPKIIHKKLKGFYSIKKVINLIPKKFLDQTKTIYYSDLYRCQNGLIASSLFLNRMLADKNSQLASRIWERNKKNMVLYCENDVRSMWAAELFLEDLLNKNKYPEYSLDEFLNQKNNIFKNLDIKK